jgi:ribonuclease HI
MIGKLPEIIVFTDGACSGNPGPGGWGAVVVSMEGAIRELGGGERATTNNRMEMAGVRGALEFLERTPGPVKVFTDSTYVIRGITQWVWGWKKNSWKTSDGKEVSNKDIWQDLFSLVQSRGQGNISWHYVRGHMGIPGNERCDEIAVAFAKGYNARLYRGPISDYRVDILTMPIELEALPDMKPKGTGKPAAYSYLSNVGGVVCRHKDWASCERRVKGQSGAKFKKATSAADESVVLKSWGLGASVEIKEG